MYENFGEIITRRRKELDMNQADIARAMSAQGFPVTNQAVSKWENELTTPSAKQFLALCEILKISDIQGEFSEGKQGLLRGIDSAGRRKIEEYIQLIRESGRYSVKKPIPFTPAAQKVRTLPLYSIPVSAGTGQFLDSDDYELTEVGSEVPESANFGVRVSGNSMEPRFHDGQNVWIHQQRSVMTGEIGIFLYDGNAYLKQLLAREDGMVLHSLNPEYSDIYISTELPLRVLGKVVG